jgi:hypothetical protein
MEGESETQGRSTSPQRLGSCQVTRRFVYLLLGNSQFLFAVDKEIILMRQFCSNPSEATGIPMLAVTSIADIEADPEQDPAPTESKVMTAVSTKTYTVPPPKQPELYRPRSFQNTRLGSYVYLVVYDIAGILFHLSLCSISHLLLASLLTLRAPAAIGR